MTVIYYLHDWKFSEADQSSLTCLIRQSFGYMVLILSQKLWKYPTLQRLQCGLCDADSNDNDSKNWYKYWLKCFYLGTLDWTVSDADELNRYHNHHHDCIGDENCLGYGHEYCDCDQDYLDCNKDGVDILVVDWADGDPWLT